MIAKNDIDWNQIILDMRSYALMSMREIHEETGILEHKLYRISSRGAYKIEYHEGVNLKRLHMDVCRGLHG